MIKHTLVCVLAVVLALFLPDAGQADSAAEDNTISTSDIEHRCD